MTKIIKELLNELELAISADFVPWSRSRNKGATDPLGNPTPSLNWRITLTRRDRPILTSVDYMAGSGHCYSSHMPDGPEERACIEAECETGRPHVISTWGSAGTPRLARLSLGAVKANACGCLEDLGPLGNVPGRSTKLVPSLSDFLRCIVSDYSVLDYADFSEWCDSFGFSSDSRKAEKLYRACLGQALSLRAGLGEAVISRLQEAFQDY